MKHKTRPPVKQDAIIRYIRSSIVDGTWKAGARIPARTVIEQRFGVSSVTVQRAFDRLREEGFIRVGGNDGTFVVDAPPHLYRYALAFERDFGGELWSQWFNVLFQAAAGLEAFGQRTLPAYMEVDEHVKSEGYRNLLRDVRTRRVAGIVFVGKPLLKEGNPILSEAGLARVILASSPPPIPGCLRVDLGGATGFIKRALDYLAERGRTRISMFCVGGVEPDRVGFFQQYAAQIGVRAEPYWLHGIQVGRTMWATNMSHLVFRGGQNDRPDGLIISDDNLVEHTCRGLVEAGVSVPEDVDVVAHCNFPAPSPSVLRLARLGYNTRVALETSLELIDRQNRGLQVPEETIVAPSFEWELPQDALRDNQ